MITTVTAAKSSITDPMPGATLCALVATNVKSGRTYAVDSAVAPISFHATLLAQVTATPQVGNWHYGVLSGDRDAMRMEWSRTAHKLWIAAQA